MPFQWLIRMEKAKPTYEELEALAQVAKILFEDVLARMEYDSRNVRQNCAPILPLSLAWHYSHILEPHKETLKKLLD